MATNGSFNTSGYDGRYLVFSWKQTSQSIADNSTTISWDLKGAGGSSGKYYITGNFKVVIDGETVYTHKDTIQLKHQVVASGTKTIYHNSDGNRKFTASASAGIYAYTSSNASGSNTWSLTQIPRQANITSAPNFNDEENPTITYSNPAGNAVSKLEACIADEKGQSVFASYRAINKTGTSYQFSLTENERNNIRNYCKNSNSRNICFYLRTTIGETNYYSYLTKTITIINALPVLNPTAKDTNQETVKITGNSSQFIRYQSTMEAKCNATAYKGATIVSQKITNSSKVVNAGTTTFTAVESGETTFEATDSRGNVIRKTLKNTCYAYINNSVSIKSAKLNADGSLNLIFSGNLYNGSLGKQNNARQAYYKYKEQGGDWVGGDWQSATNKIVIGNYQTYEVNTTITGLDYTKTYVVQAAIEDTFKFRSTPEQVVVSKPVFAWGKDEFIFNAPTISGSVYSLEGIPDKNLIRAGGDFSNYVKPGVYCVPQSDEMASIKNVPPAGNIAGRLIVVSSLGGTNPGGIWSYIIQKFIPYNAKGCWMRYAATSTTPGAWQWSGWNHELTADEVDYVVAKGTSNGWDYRKWNSGFAECTKRIWCGKCPRANWGNNFSYAMAGSRQTLPFPFKYIPTTVATLESASNNGWLATDAAKGGADENHTTAYQCVRPNDGGATLDLILDYHVFGFWKWQG